MGSPAGTDLPDETAAASEPTTGKTRELQSGATLGKYRLDKVLGSGGMGVVWSAHDPDLERAVALKVLRYDDPTPELRTRLLREARAMARLKHPNVVTVYDVDSEGDRDFIAMELVEGKSLDAWVATKPSRAEVWDAVLAAGRGLAAAHRAGLVHRDFKPHNVLHSDDGRVLVTDFGLARGTGEEGAIAMESTLPVKATALEETLDATRSKSSSLDATLTRTGAVLGTPAYMAPEQFLGAPSDPRTDQFAYCVTAWQMFAGGERPFRGTTVDELRASATAGVSGVAAAIPGAIRAVLARGLASEPAQRWPDMKCLLDALESARERPRRMRRHAFSAAVVVLGGALAIKIAMPSQMRTPRPQLADAGMCAQTPDVEIVRAWSPEMRAAVFQKFGNGPGVASVVDALDDYSKRWTADYRTACDMARSTKAFAKIGCLLGQRDELQGITELIPVAPADVLVDAEMSGILPRTEACDGDTPVPPPVMPDDPAKRDGIKKLRAKLIAAYFTPASVMLPRIPALVAEAEGLGWEPVLAEAHHAWGMSAKRAEALWEVSREHLQIAHTIAQRSRHYRIEADTATDLVDNEYDVATDPADDKTYAELVTQARAAVRNAGSDPAFVARILKSEGAFSESRGRLDDAIAKYDQARMLELSSHDYPNGIRYAVAEFRALMLRARPDDLTAAAAVLDDTQRALGTAKVVDSKQHELWLALGFTAAVQGDLKGMHEWFDRIGGPKVPTGTVPVSGRVVDEAGKGVAGAQVIAWRGTLDGDAIRTYGSTGFEGDMTTTDATGQFTVRGLADGGIIAELAGKRSQPKAITPGEMTLALAATRTITGTVASDDTPLVGIVISAFYKVGPTAAWRLRAPVAPTHEYTLAGLPPGQATARIDTNLDPNRPVRKIDFGPLDRATPRWPTGPTVDVITRGAFEPETLLWLFRGKITAATRADLTKAALATDFVITHNSYVIGIGDQTVEGMKVYKRKDRHGRFTGTAPGEITLCAAGPAETSRATCKTIDLRGAVLEMRDGRGIYPAVPVVLER